MKCHRITFLIVIYALLATYSCQQVGTEGAGSDIIYEFRTEIDNPLFNSNDEMLDWAVENGYKRVMVKSVRGNQYQFTSPTLEATGAYEFVGEKLSPFVDLVHERGLKLIVNIEGINPHFSLNNPFLGKVHEFTEQEISSICRELLAIGVDGLAEEDFDAAPDHLRVISQICRENNLIHIHFTNNSVICGYNYWHSVPRTVFEVYKGLDEIQSLDYTWDRTNCRVCGSFQGNTMVYAVAKGLGLKLDLKTAWGAELSYTASYDQGENEGRVRWVQQSPTVMQHLMFIRALQFKLNSIAICFWADPPSLIDISGHRNLIDKYTAMQVTKPILNIVIPLTYDDNWRHLQYSSEAICSGGLLAGYDIVATDHVLPEADAYYVVTKGYSGTETKDISNEVMHLFNTDKPVFLQCVDYVPYGQHLTANWTTVLSQVGLRLEDARFEPGELPRGGIFNGSTHQYGGYQFGSKSFPRRQLIHQGTVIPEGAVTGDILSQQDNVPYVLGNNGKYLFTGSCLNFENSFVIANLLGNTLQRPADVFGVVGKRVSAFYAVNNTALEINLPSKSSSIHITRYNHCGDKTQDERVGYSSPYSADMLQGDLLIIEAR